MGSAFHTAYQIHYNTKITLALLSVLNGLNEWHRMPSNPTFAKAQQQKKDSMIYQLKISQFGLTIIFIWRSNLKRPFLRRPFLTAAACSAGTSCQTAALLCRLRLETKLQPPPQACWEEPSRSLRAAVTRNQNSHSVTPHSGGSS